MAGGMEWGGRKRMGIGWDRVQRGGGYKERGIKERSIYAKK